MSELTTCNYCNLKRMEEDAKAEGNKVTLIPSKSKMGGSEVYVHPRSINIKKFNRGQLQRFWVAWMMEITDHCVC